MPVDLKKIAFSNQEVQAALVNFCRRKNISMPATLISRVVVNWETELTSNIHFMSDDGEGEGKVLHFSNEELAAALIIYCHLFNDPLPKKAKKTLDPAGDGVMLSIRHSWGDMVDKTHPGFSIPWMIEGTDADTDAGTHADTHADTKPTEAPPLPTPPDKS